MIWGTFKLGQEIECNRARLTKGDRVLVLWSKHIKEGRKGQHVNSECTESMEKKHTKGNENKPENLSFFFQVKIHTLLFFLIAVLDLVQYDLQDCQEIKTAVSTNNQKITNQKKTT